MRGIDKQRARNRNALPLAPRERLSPLAHQRIVAMCQAKNELMGVGGTGRSNDLLLLRVGFAIRDVLGNCSKKQEGFLKHQADVLAVFGDRQRTNIHPIQQDRAFGDVIEAADQVDQRTLAGAAMAHQADHFARLDSDADVTRHTAGTVAESDVTQLDAAFDDG